MARKLCTSGWGLRFGGVVLAMAFASAGAGIAQDSLGWATYNSAVAGLAFDYPAAVFSEQGGDPTEALKDRTADRAGRSFATADGRATLQIATFPNLDNVSVDQLKRRAIAAAYGDAKIDYNRTAGTWYVLSGTRGAETFYERVQFNCNNRRIDIWTVTYPTADAARFDELVDDIARRYRAQQPNIKCG